MKNALLLLLASALIVSSASAFGGDPTPVPDSGATAGLLALGALAAFALRRKKQ